MSQMKGHGSFKSQCNAHTDMWFWDSLERLHCVNPNAERLKCAPINNQRQNIREEGEVALDSQGKPIWDNQQAQFNYIQESFM